MAIGVRDRNAPPGGRRVARHALAQPRPHDARVLRAHARGPKCGCARLRDAASRTDTQGRCTRHTTLAFPSANRSHSIHLVRTLRRTLAIDPAPFTPSEQASPTVPMQYPVEGDLDRLIGADPRRWRSTFVADGDELANKDDFRFALRAALPPERRRAALEWLTCGAGR